MGLAEVGFQEILRVKPLADEPALHVRHANQDGVDDAFGNLLLEMIGIRSCWLL
jgi:hypothetical protein